MMRAITSAIVLAASVAAAEPKAPHGITQVTIDYAHVSFGHLERSYAIAWKDGAYRAGARVIDAALIEAVVASLTDLRPADHDVKCTSHTDDYPSFRVALGDHIVVSSSSNCHAHVPWNVVRDGKRFMQLTGAVDRAVNALLVAVDPDHWKPAAVPDPTTWGSEWVVLDEYKSGDTASSSAAACARDLEASPHAREQIGAAPQVSRLLLVCDLATSADCAAPVATAMFAWAGLDAQVELPCPGGRVRLDDLDKLRAFVLSKPARVLVQLSKSPPRMRGLHGAWQIVGDGDVPALYYKDGTQLTARASAEHPPAAAFWKALGLNAAKLARKNSTGEYDIVETLDFTGKLVP